MVSLVSLPILDTLVAEAGQKAAGAGLKKRKTQLLEKQKISVSLVYQVEHVNFCGQQRLFETAKKVRPSRESSY